MVHFSMNYTFWLNIAFGLFAITLFAVVRRYPMQHRHSEHHALTIANGSRRERAVYQKPSSLLKNPEI